MLPTAFLCTLALSLSTLNAEPQVPSTLQVQLEADATELLDASGRVFHRTQQVVTNLRRVELPLGGGFVALWNEGEQSQAVSHYAVFREASGFSRVREADYNIHMKRGVFDPKMTAPEFPASELNISGNMHLVQFVCPPLAEFRNELARMGATIQQFIPNNTRIVYMEAGVANAVAALPFVRWVGPFQGNYRLERELLDGLAAGSLPELTHCYVSVFEKGPRQKATLAPKLRSLGAQIVAQIPDGYRLEAMLSPEQIVAVAGLDEVAFIDRWSAPEEDLDIVRSVGGANALQTLEGYTGQGVRGEVMDGDVLDTHNAFQSNPIIRHGGNSGSADHGTKTTGCVFSDGTGSASGRGMLPDGQPIFADYGFLGNRYTHTAQLLQPPYNAVFQSNSWGGGLTTSYNSTSQQMDDILFDFDITICQSQSNTGSTQSRPQAWAKNIVSVGAVRHGNTANLGNDAWGGSGSIGPAADGRIKPDLCFWYESIRTTDDNSNSAYTSSFGGTSAATPCVAGYVGLTQQMWSNGIFGNTPVGNTVFERRAKATTLRALLVNSATQYTFNGSNHDLTRTHQGWGLPDVETLHSNKDSMLIVDEELLLSAGTSTIYQVQVPAGGGPFKATLCYLDPAGTTSANQHRINDLSLQVSAPDGTFYWGNNGLLSGNWSTTGGSSNTKDVIENVFVENPTPGTWTVEIFADEINQDGHVETGALDVDFALVVSGITGSNVCNQPASYCAAKLNSSGLLAFLSSDGLPQVSTPGFSISMELALPNKNALIFSGLASNNLPFQGGVLCVSTPITRGELKGTDVIGSVTFALDLSNKAPSTTEFYQVWYRDPADSFGFGSGLSNAMAVTYCP
jgi:serine protease AprX